MRTELKIKISTIKDIKRKTFYLDASMEMFLKYMILNIQLYP